MKPQAHLPVEFLLYRSWDPTSWSLVRFHISLDTPQDVFRTAEGRLGYTTHSAFFCRNQVLFESLGLAQRLKLAMKPELCLGVGTVQGLQEQPAERAGQNPDAEEDTVGLDWRGLGAAAGSYGFPLGGRNDCVDLPNCRDCPADSARRCVTVPPQVDGMLCLLKRSLLDRSAHRLVAQIEPHWRRIGIDDRADAGGNGTARQG